MADFWNSAGYDSSWGDSAGAQQFAATQRPSANTNPAGAADDPFAYTKGSLLTPWEGTFDSSKFPVGGGGPAAYRPFVYGDLNYTPSLPNEFGERYQDPGNFVYGEYTGQDTFKAPTEADMKADPGYEARQAAGQRAITASKAAQGILRTGGAAKEMNQFAQDQASQEYGQVYGRKVGEYNLAEDQNRFRYGTNRANAKDAFDTNVNNARTAYQVRQGTWRDNAASQQQNANIGWTVASGEYDRNEAKARQQYEDLRSYENAVAGAAASGNAQAYQRALDDYKMKRDEFYTNQDRQYAILNAEDVKGRDAAYRYGDTSAGMAMQRGDAQAAGTVGAANAWSNAAGNMGSFASDMALYAMRRPLPRASVS